MRDAGIRRTVAVLADGLLWITAIGGAISLILSVAMVATGTSLILYTGGSMAPTIERGAVTVTQQVRADEVRVGDVLTVDRPGQHPISHRVTSVSEIAGTAMSSITMRGDANGRDDDEMYVISTARRHLFTVPISAHTLVAVLASPFTWGLIVTGLVGFLVITVLRRRRARRMPAVSAPYSVTDTGRHG